MKVWVIVSDCGLNGPWVHAVLDHDPDLSSIDLQRKYVNPESAHPGGDLPGGYAGTTAKEFEVETAVD